MAHLALRRPAACPRRPAYGLWRRFHVRIRRVTAAAALALGTAAGCMAPPEVLPATHGPGTDAAVRVVDEKGRPALRPAQEVGRRLGNDAHGGPLAHHLAHVEETLAAPLVLGNDAHLLVDGPDTHEAMLEAIGRARHHIHLETYILEEAEPGERLAELLKAKSAEGVVVRLLYDSVGSLSTPPEYFAALEAAGVAVCEFNPVNPLKAPRGWRLNNRNHRKVLVVDGAVAFTGGINISGVYSAGSFGSKRREGSRDEGWRDTHVRVEGPVVADFQRLFLDGWTSQACSRPPSGDYAGDTRRHGDMAMRLVAADPEIGRSELYVALLSAIGLAQDRVWLTYGYFVPDPGLLDTLKEAAGRGVDVRLVLPGFSDFWAPFHAGRSHYAELLEAGVRILERRDALLHAKTAVIDGVWSSVGSTNLDWRSFVHNYEADVLVLDPGFGGEMEALFRRDEETSHEINAKEWRGRGITPRLLEWLARRWEYLL